MSNEHLYLHLFTISSLCPCLCFPFSSIYLFCCAFIRQQQKNVYDKSISFKNVSRSIWASILSVYAQKYQMANGTMIMMENLRKWAGKSEKRGKNSTRNEMITIKMIIIMTVEVITIKYKCPKWRKNLKCLEWFMYIGWLLTRNHENFAKEKTERFFVRRFLLKEIIVIWYCFGISIFDNTIIPFLLTFQRTKEKIKTTKLRRD